VSIYEKVSGEQEKGGVVVGVAVGGKVRNSGCNSGSATESGVKREKKGGKGVLGGPSRLWNTRKRINPLFVKKTNAEPEVGGVWGRGVAGYAKDKYS